MRFFPIFITLLAAVSLKAYSVSDYIRDLTDDRERVFSNLHPKSKEKLKEAFDRMRSGDMDLSFIFFGKDMDGISEMNDLQIWNALCEEAFGDEIYSPGKTSVFGTLDKDDLRIFIIQDRNYEPEPVFDTIVFKKDGNEYLPMIPEFIIIGLSIPE